MSGSIENWQDWHEELIALVNGDFVSKKLRVLCEIFPRVCFRVGSRNLLTLASEPLNLERDKSQSIALSIPESISNIRSVTRMKKWIRRHLKNDLFAVILHGSLGTDEVVNYSDFDALVIIKDEVFTDKNRLARVAHHLFQARKFMYEHDPLQHHGWFVVPECALQSWPESYLPVEALKNASQILSENSQEIVFNPIASPKKCGQHLLGLTVGIQNDLSNNLYGKSLYKFKSLMSKVLLLPTLYLQSGQGTGVFKRESFDLAKDKFTKEDWSAVVAASNIRQAWPNVRPLFPSIFSKRPGLIGDTIRRRSKRVVPSELLAQFGKNEQKALMQLMQQVIK